MSNTNGGIKRRWTYLLLLSIGLLIFYAGVYTSKSSKCVHVFTTQGTLDHPGQLESASADTLSRDASGSNRSKDGGMLFGSQRMVKFKDEHKHLHDSRETYDALSKTVRIFCWIMTSPANHRSRAFHVQATWGKRCDKLVFVSEGEDALLPIIKVDSGSGRDHLTAKTMLAFHKIFEMYKNDYDWFMKADDDTYVIVENLKYFLSTQEPKSPIFFGHHFKPYIRQGYFSGGAGYIMSREALNRFGKKAKIKCDADGGAEDVAMGKCMENLGVKAGDSRDSLGRSRFHCFNPGTHVQGGYPDWYLKYDMHGASKGIESISDYAISFHYMNPEDMYNMEFFIYHLRPFGIITGLQELNRPKLAHHQAASTAEALMSPSTSTPVSLKESVPTVSTQGKIIGNLRFTPSTFRPQTVGK